MFYLILVLKEHEACLTMSGENFTLNFDYAFLAGLITFLCETTNSNIFGLYIHLKNQLEVEAAGHTHACT